jgi:hypothetical protein
VLGLEAGQGVFELADTGVETGDAVVEVLGGGEDKASALAGGQ